jgi:hypothetical protein
MRPTEPSQLRDQLFAIFPDLRDEWEVPDDAFKGDGRIGYHGVMAEFSDYFTGRAAALSELQLRVPAGICNQAVEVDDELEIAVSTVFLEDMQQMKVAKLLGPFLSARARRKSHA